MSRSLVYLLSSLCVLFATVGGLVTYMEIRAAITGGSTMLVTDNPPETLYYSISSFSRKRVLLRCTTLLYVAASPEHQTNRSMTETCQQASEDIASSMATNSQAWFVNAFARSLSGDIPGFLSSYKQSHATAPNEVWLAQHRARLASDILATLDSEANKIYDRDLMALGSTQAGLVSLVSLYQASGDRRERTVQAISKLPTARQRAFLRLVAQASQQP